MILVVLKMDVEDAELYMRYVQFGTFSPIFRLVQKEVFIIKESLGFGTIKLIIL